ncbi:hypothetical protein HPSNAG_1562 [Glaesserella parasuis str. Nagasaki]|nr:hypothetical protein HPSNAG_1562 [Glaesserella parasuis str. Nagasaki]
MASFKYHLYYIWEMDAKRGVPTFLLCAEYLPKTTFSQPLV